MGVMEELGCLGDLGSPILFFFSTVIGFHNESPLRSIVPTKIMRPKEDL